MNEKELMNKKTKNISKLLGEYCDKLTHNTNEKKILLIDFAREYNKIWSDDGE